MHLGMSGDYNEVHPHARYSHGPVHAGVYYNSHERVSFYLGRSFELSNKVVVELGGVTGYAFADVVPMARAVYRPVDRVGVFFSPAYEKHNGPGAILGLELRLF